MELRKLTASDYDELLEVLNSVFTRENKKPMDFLNLLPKMWVRDDQHMGYHTGIFEDGKLVSVAGCYPLPAKIAGIPFLFATTGNVATLPEYEGRGYFTTIFTELMKELEQMDVDAARLNGARQRYARYGYEPAGSVYQVVFTENNRLKYFHDAGSDLVFKEIERSDLESLAFCDTLSRKSDFYVDRSTEEDYRDVYLALRGKHATPYLAVKKNLPVGYLVAVDDKQMSGHARNGRHIYELRYNCLENFIEMVCAWQRKVDDEITFRLAPYMTEEMELISPCAEYITVSSPSHFKIRDYERLADALLKLKASKESLLNGEVILGIKDYGTIKLFVSKDNQGCIKTEEKPELILDQLSATRMLFGHVPYYTAGLTANPLWKNWLPLPFSWNIMDSV